MQCGLRDGLDSEEFQNYLPHVRDHRSYSPLGGDRFQCYHNEAFAPSHPQLEW